MEKAATLFARKGNCRCSTALAFAIAVIASAVTSVRAEVYTFQPIADTRSAFTDLSLFPSINASGTVAFRAESETGSGIFTGNGGAPVAVADTASFADFGIADPKVKNGNTIAFFANLASGGSGIFVGSGAGIEKIADTSDAFAPGDAFVEFGAPGINRAGTVAFAAASASRDLAVFTRSAGGSISKVGPATPRTFSFLAPEAFINGDADVAVVAMTSGGEARVLTSDPPAPFATAAETSGPLFSSIDLISPYLTEDGLSVFFLATRKDTGESGIYRATGSEISTVVDTSGGFRKFGDFASSANGTRFAFSAVTDDGRVGIFDGSDAQLDKVITVGEQLAAGGSLRQVDSLSLGDGGLNAAGEIAFYASFSDSPETSQPGFAGIFRALPVPAASTAEPGPSTTSAPYIVPSAEGVSTRSVFTVGDSVNKKPDGVTPYRMVGIPDGLGLLDNGDQTFTLFMNHEIAPTSGVPRRHHAGDTSGRGAFVSQWRIVGAGHPSLPFLSVLNGNDLIQTVRIFDPVTRTYRAPLANPVPGAGEDDFNRFCSADLPAVSAYFFNGLGTTERIYMTGEESPAENGRAFGNVVTGAVAGTSFELPRLGDAAWENVIANPFPQEQTVVMLNDDQAAVGGQVTCTSARNSIRLPTRAPIRWSSRD